MKKRLFVLSALALFLHATSWAYDFSAKNDDGVTIYYNIRSEKTKTTEVTYLYYNSTTDSSEAYSGAVSIPETVTYDGTTYTVTEIGDMAFYWCDGLTSVTIPNSVTTIGYGAFWGCTGLREVTIGNSVTMIGDEAFGFCKRLDSITSLNPTPPSCGFSTFFNSSEYIVLYVPSGAKEAYSKATGWEGDFFNIEEINGDEDETSTFEPEIEIRYDVTSDSITIFVYPSVTIVGIDEDITVSNESGIVTTAKASQYGDFWILTFVETLEAGTYTVTIPEGFFKDETGESSEESSFSFEVGESSASLDIEVSEPTVSAKDGSFSVSISSETTLEIVDDTRLVPVTNADGVVVAYVRIEVSIEVGVYIFYIVDEKGNETKIEAAGEYTVTIPEGFFKDEAGELSKETSFSFEVEKEIKIVKGSIAWSFNEGTEGQEARFTVGTNEAYVNTAVAIGSNLSYAGTITVTDANEANATYGESVTFTLFDHTKNQAEANETNAIDFTVTMADGYKFIPREATLYATRVGTNECNMNISWIDSEGNETPMIATSSDTGDNPGIANGTPNTFTKYTLDLAEYGIEIVANATFTLRIYVFGMAMGETFGLSNIVIGGDVEGVTEDDIYVALSDEMATLETNLDNTWSTIETEYPEVAADDNVLTKKEAIESEIYALQTTVDASYAEETLADDVAYYEAQIAAIQAEIEQLLADVIATGVNAITIENLRGKSIYTISGQKVNAPTMAGIYIIDGKKVIMKK